MKYKGIGIGNFGDASIFSFHATKVFNTIEGGCVSYQDKNMEKKLRAQKNFGMETPESYITIGGNAKMNEFQAAMGICNLRHIDNEIAKREQVVKKYMELLNNKGITIWRPQENVTHNCAYFPVLFDKKIFGKSRDDIAEELANQDIYARKYFYPLTSDFECYKGMFKINDTPVAKYVSDNILTLPLFADLKLEDVERICDIILKK